MSHSFYLTNVESPKFSKIIEAMGLQNLNFVEGYSSPKDDNWPTGFTYVYLEHISARSIEVEYNGGLFQVKIFAASSPADYQLALKLVKAVAKIHCVDIEPEDNDSMTLDTFVEVYNNQWIKEHCKSMVSMLLGDHAKNPEAVSHVSGVSKTMTIGPKLFTQLRSYKNKIAQEFFIRLKKLNYIHLEDVYQSMISLCANAEGDKHVRMSTYGEGVETLLWDKNTLVRLMGEDDLVRSDEREQVVVPLEKLPDIIGEKALWLSEDLLLVPRLNGDRWKSFIEKAREYHIEDIFELGFDPANDPFAEEGESGGSQARGEGLTDEILHSLAYAPLAVFFIVAAADGSIDKKEIEAFQQELVKGVVTDSEVLIQTTAIAIANFERMIQELTSQAINIQEKLLEITLLLNSHLPEEEAKKFKASLIQLGEKVASASGGFLGIFGSKISKQEKQALAALKTVLVVRD